MPSPKHLGNRAYSLLMFLVVSVLSGVLISGLAVPYAAMAGASAKVVSDAMENLPADLEVPPQAEGSKLMLSDGTVLAEIYEENRTYVPMDRIAPIMRQAQVAIEDHRFYEHGALDFTGTMRALLKTGGEAGGSTITQQYVKLVQIEKAYARGDSEGVAAAQERTIARKVQELRYAVAMETKLSKDQILERYLNIALYGDGAYGVEAAAHHFFNTTAQDLTVAQAAMLAGMVQNPSAYNPALHPKAAIERRDTVLFRMYDLNIISKEQYDEARATTFDPEQIQPKRNGCVGSRFPQLCMYAMEEMVRNQNIPGDSAEERRATIGRSAYNITLTIDPAAQDFAQREINKWIKPTDPVIATTAFVQPGTGKILVMAQSRPQVGDEEGQTWWNYNADYGHGGAEGYQAGSTFKIFTAAAALERGIPPTTRYNSPARMSFQGKTFESCDGPYVLTDKYTASNDLDFSGNPDMYLAAQQSVNTYFLQLEQAATICETTKMADAAGVHATNGKSLTTESNVAVFTLGPVEVSPLSMANAYATFAARGVRCDNSIIAAITTKDGQAVPTLDPKCTQAIRPEVADGVNAVFKTVVDKGSGMETRTNGYDLAGKTGTTDKGEHLWYNGYSPDIAGSSMIAVDKTNAFWGSREKSLSRLTLPSGTYLNGYGSPDCTRFFTPILRELLGSTPATKFTQAPDEILKGKLVDVPTRTNNPDADEAAVKAAGFQVQRVNTNSTLPRGTYLGISPTGKQPVGTVIQLMFSDGAGRAAPTTQAPPTTEAPPPTEPPPAQSAPPPPPRPTRTNR